MKNVLLIGDLRSSTGNYGAYANSENLIRELKKRTDINLKTIDGRSFWKETPPNGWSQSLDEYIRLCRNQQLREDKIIGIKGFVKKIPYAVELLNKFRHRERKIFVPALYEQYEEFSSKEVLLYERKLIEWADYVLINGEGNIVRGTDEQGYYRLGGLYVLYIAYLSKVVLGKRTYIINHTVDPGNRDVIEIIKKIYPLMDGIFIRENLSINLLKKWGINNARFIPDSLFLYGNYSTSCNLPKIYKDWREASKKLILIGDSSGIENAYTKVKWDVVSFYGKLIVCLKRKGYQIAFVDGFDGNNLELNHICKRYGLLHLKMSNCSYKELFEIYKETEIYVSGRWHTSILALQAKCPILLWGADSHKTEALYDLINYPYSFFDVNSLPIHINDIMKEIERIVTSDNSAVFERVKELSRLSKEIAYIF